MSVFNQSDNLPPVAGGTANSIKKFLDNVKILKDLKEEVIKIVKLIHRDFGEHSLIISGDNVPVEKRLAVWS